MATETTVSSELPIEATPQVTLSADAWRIPLSLRIVAYGFILVGTLSAIETLLFWFACRNFGFVWFAVFVWGLFVGWGLLRWRKSARESAVVLTWFALIFVPAWLLVVESSFRDITTSNVLVYIGLWLYFAWQLRVLRRPDTVQRFQTTRFARLMANGGVDPLGRSRGLRFSLATLFWVVTIAAIVIVLVRLRSQDVLYEISPISTAQGFEYGVRSSRFSHSPDELAYVLFIEEYRGRSVWKQTGLCLGGYYEEYGVRLPNGEEIMLPGRHQLYEFADGTLRTCDERVTLTQLEDFINSQPAKWSLDALVQHAQQMRAKQEE